MAELKLTSIGNSIGMILPREMLARLGMEKGDTLFISETPDGFTVSTSDPDFEAQMAVAERIMKERQAVLRELAK
jgi:putative addiction module antidote